LLPDSWAGTTSIRNKGRAAEVQNPGMTMADIKGISSSGDDAGQSINRRRPNSASQRGLRLACDEKSVIGVLAFCCERALTCTRFAGALPDALASARLDVTSAAATITAEMIKRPLDMMSPVGRAFGFSGAMNVRRIIN
jgi:hypothetical protein